MHRGQALVIFAITYAATTVALAVLGVASPHASTTVQAGVVLIANILSTGARFVAMQRWIVTGPKPADSTGPDAARPEIAPPTEPSSSTDRHEPAYADDVVLPGGRPRD